MNSLPTTNPRAYRFAFWLLRQIFGRYITTHASGLHNLPPEGTPTIVIFNHASALDYGAAHALQRRGYYAIKREAANFPLSGRLVRAVGGIPIKRDEQDSEALRAMLAVLEAGKLLVIAPEGTRSRTGRLGEFDPGFVWLAARTGAQVVPVVVHGTRDLLPAGKLIPRRGHIWVHAGPPITYADEGRRIPRDRLTALAAAARETMLDMLADLEQNSGVPNTALDERRPPS